MILHGLHMKGLKLGLNVFSEPREKNYLPDVCAVIRRYQGLHTEVNEENNNS